MILALVYPGLLLTGLGFRVFRRKAKGGIGEWQVANAIRGLGMPLVNDVVLPGKTGLTQIDHVVLTRSGLVVLETKNYSGDLYDQGRGRDWVQRIGGRKNYHHNPLDQNYGHKRAVEKAAGNVAVHAFVVLAGNGRFPKAWPEGVLTIRGLKRKLKELNQGSDPISPSLGTAWQRLLDADRKDADSHQAQLRQVTRGGLRYWIEAYWPWMAGAGIGMVFGGIWL